ncbi:hypothetical protein MUK42_11256 [Musa troglodytarum]|uniref:Uncharacterized protein n=1 Tax=Musa troglodytarum TaxID=320322 RepID=A0A9E7GBF1_9LILI|nr:hypothetical protein MUK42_11256 [Musa troglodytarum]
MLMRSLVAKVALFCPLSHLSPSRHPFPLYLCPLPLLGKRERERARAKEGENKPSSSIADELASVDTSFGSSSSSSNYFSTVFPPPSTVIAKHSSPGDLYRTLNRQGTDGHIGNAQNAVAVNYPDIMILLQMCYSRGSPTRGQTTQGKDLNPVYPNLSEESAWFGLTSDQISGAPKSYKTSEGNKPGDTNTATRGEWFPMLLKTLTLSECYMFLEEEGTDEYFVI